MGSCWHYHKRARMCMKGNYGKGFLICLVYDLLIGVASMFFYVPAILFTGYLTFGLMTAFLVKARGQTDEIFIGNLFKAKNYGSADIMVLGIMSSLFIFLWSLLLIIPGIVKSFGYSMAYYVKFDNPKLDWSQCLEESQDLIYGYKRKLFLLDLTIFIVWIPLIILTLGIASFWYTPFMQAAHASFYDDLCKEYYEDTTQAPAKEAYGT